MRVWLSAKCILYYPPSVVPGQGSGWSPGCCWCPEEPYWSHRSCTFSRADGLQRTAWRSSWLEMVWTVWSGCHCSTSDPSVHRDGQGEDETSQQRSLKKTNHPITIQIWFQKESMNTDRREVLTFILSGVSFISSRFSMLCLLLILGLAPKTQAMLYLPHC